MRRAERHQNVIGTCDHGMMLCTDDRPGHAMTLLRLRLSSSTPAGWVDAIFVEAADGGWVRLRLWDSGDERWVWHHASLTGSLQAGDPVALHEVYSVLAIGSDRLNVARL